MSEFSDKNKNIDKSKQAEYRNDTTTKFKLRGLQKT